MNKKNPKLKLFLAKKELTRWVDRAPSLWSMQLLRRLNSDGLAVVK